MKKNEMEQMQRGLENLADCLDTQWIGMENAAELSRKMSVARYNGMIQTLKSIGGDFVKDSAGHHRVFLAGLSSSENDEYKAG